MSQTRFVDLARSSTESSTAKQVDFDSVIRNFAIQESQKSAYIIVKWFFSHFFLDKILLPW